MRCDSPAARFKGRPVLRAAALLLACAVGGGALPGCTQMPDAMSAAFADPAKYDLYNCVQLRTARKDNSRRIAELRGLIARADTATGGPVVAEVDCSAVVGRKRAALAAHASQLDNACFLAMAPEAYAAVFATEAYGRPGAPGGRQPAGDLFAGLR